METALALTHKNFMPPLKRWVQFLGGAGGMIGAGLLFINYALPTDEDIIKSMSPEVRQRYEREKRMREKAGEIMQRRINESVDKPAWLQGASAMQKLDREIMEEARLTIEKEDQGANLATEKERLRALAEQEKKLK